MQDSERQTENKLGTMSIGRLLARMSLPTMFSMLIHALYNIVDSIFVSHYSEKALTAVSLAFPLQSLMIAFSVGTGVGICSVISRRLGEKREDASERAAQTGYALVLVFTLAFILIGALLTKPFLKLYTDDAELVRMATTYASICLILSFGCFISIFCEKALQATGDTVHPMLIQLAGAVFNVIFDPIMIFGYMGFPAMGIAGAAYATVLGQILSMVLGIIFLKRSRYLKVRFLKPSMDGKAVKDILVVGVPGIIMQGVGTIMISLMNAILIAFSALATTVFGLYFKLQSFVFLPVFGMNSGLMPILGYNYGAKNRRRMMHALKLAMVFALAYMSLGTVVFMAFPEQLLGMFNASAELRVIGEVALRAIALSFPLAAISIMMGALFQAMGDGTLSMATSIVRQIFFLIPSAWLFGRLWGLDAVWYSYIFAEVFALIMSILFFRKELRKLEF